MYHTYKSGGGLLYSAYGQGLTPAPPLCPLSGDNWRTARAIAAQLDISDVHAEVLPATKATKVMELQVRAGSGCCSSLPAGWGAYDSSISHALHPQMSIDEAKKGYKGCSSSS